jgi:hypothetical protein
MYTVVVLGMQAADALVAVSNCSKTMYAAPKTIKVERRKSKKECRGSRIFRRRRRVDCHQGIDSRRA